MFLIIYVVQYNINLYQLHKNIEKIVIMVLMLLKRLHIKIFRKGFEYMGYMIVFYGGYKKVIKKLMGFQFARKVFL